MPTVTVEAGEPKKLVAESDPMGRYEFQVSLNDVRLSDRRADVTEGRIVRDGREGTFIKDKNTEAIWALSEGADAEVEVEKSRFEINLYPPLTLRGTRPNSGGVVGDTITPGAAGTSFGDQAVPDGYEVVIQNDPGNADDVKVADDGGTGRHVITPGSSFTVSVENLNDITVIGTANNPTVHATVEAPT